MANFQIIKQLAKDRKMSLGYIADQCGITQAGLSLLMRDGKTLTQTIEKIANVLDVPVGIFFDENYGNVVLPSDVALQLKRKDEIIAKKDEVIIDLTNKVLELSRK